MTHKVYSVSICRRVRKNCKKATISFVMSVRPHGTNRLHKADFHEISYLSIFRQSAKKIQVSFKSEKNKVYFT